MQLELRVIVDRYPRNDGHMHVGYITEIIFDSWDDENGLSMKGAPSSVNSGYAWNPARGDSVVEGTEAYLFSCELQGLKV